VNLLELWNRTGLVQRVVLLALVLGGVGAAAMLVGWARTPSMALLYSGLAPETAGRVVEKVQEAGVPYELKSGGSAVFVPQDKVYSLRLELAADGLPGGDQAGYRILDEEKIGASPFLQRLNYRRALEGEIARSIQLLEGVGGARVHVVRPESSLFGGADQAATATVVLKLRPGWRLAGTHVAAIVHMVAGSVEGLQPKDVVVVDSAGTLLSSGSEDEFARTVGTFLDAKSRHEEYLAQKVEAMLTQVLGPGRATVRVSCLIDNNSTTQTVETYSPDGKVATKEEITSSSTTGAPAEAAAAGSALTKEETTSTDYLVGRTVKQEVVVPGKVSSVSVAAMVDLTPPAAPAAPADGAAAAPPAPAAPTVKSADIEELIRSALGLTEKDTVKVVETPFARALPATQDDAAATEADGRAFYLDVAKHASLGILVLGALAALKIFGGPRKHAAAAGGAGSLAGGPGMAGALPAGSGSPDELRSRMSAALMENPEEVKRLFLAWVANEKGAA
jgi:flagellar M-ring protein FliF